MAVEGFRLSAASSVEADQASWDIWQANQMDAQSQVAFVESLVKGVSYLSVWEGERDGALPVIAVEDPSQTIVEYVPGSNYTRRAAALKVWDDEILGVQRANVYLPGGIFKFQRDGSEKSASATLTGDERTFGDTVPGGARSSSTQTAGWVEIEDSFVKNPWKVVPIIPLRNRPRLTMEGESEIEDVYRIQNQINGFLFLLALAGYMGAHRQRWATGLELMEDDKGRPVEPFNSAVDRLWATENPQVKFGEFSQTDLDGYIRAIEQKILHIAVTTRTPRHYLVQDGQSPSGDALRSAESGLTKKVERKQRTFGEGLEEAIRLARSIQSGADIAAVDSEIVWAQPGIRTEAEITDAAVKRWSTGLVPWEQALEDIGYSATQIARMKNLFGGSPEPPVSSPLAA